MMFPETPVPANPLHRAALRTITPDGLPPLPRFVTPDTYTDMIGVMICGIVPMPLRWVCCSFQALHLVTLVLLTFGS